MQIAELSGVFILVPIANGCHGDSFSDQSLRTDYTLTFKYVNLITDKVNQRLSTYITT